jgi:hypothetical protein
MGPEKNAEAYHCGTSAAGLQASAIINRTPDEEKGESMTEEGTLSIVIRENAYQVRYASNNPHTMDQRQPYTCTDTEHLGAFLHQCGSDPWSIHQACAELRKGRQGALAVLSIVLSAEQVQASFPLLSLSALFHHERPGCEFHDPLT